MRKGRSVYHCHGKKKGKKIRTYSSAAKAKKAHRAMMANRNRASGRKRNTAKRR